MFDVSERFLHQLAADRRERLHRSGRTSALRPLRGVLRSALARLGLAGDFAGGAGSLTSTEGETHRTRDGSSRSTQSIGSASVTDVVVSVADTSKARLGRGAQQG